MAAPRVFAIAPSRDDTRIVERVSYATTVHLAYGGSEQRLQRRANPELGLGYGFTAATALEASLSRYLFDLAPEDGLLVPWWPALAELTAPAAEGATALAADLSGLPVIEQDGERRYLLWRSAFDHEALVASDVSDAGLTLASPLAGAWGAGARLLPLVHVFPAEAPRWDRHERACASGTLDFVAGLVTDYRLPSGPDLYLPDGYLGLDVLTSTPGDPASSDAWSRRVSVVAADAGREARDSQDAAAGRDRSMRYRLADRAAQAAVRRFFAARLGRLRPFWAPTWDVDLETTELATAGSGLIVVRDPGYTDARVESGNARSHLAVRLPSGAWQYLEVGAHEHFDETGVAALELWTPGPGEDLPAGHPLSILRHVRLASDTLELEHWHRTYAEARLDLHELPVDCPSGVTT